MKKIMLLVLLFISLNIDSQDIGYLGGLSKLGIDAKGFQPLYGFSIGTDINRYLAIETDFFYSQRTIQSSTQADYFTFMLMPKIGYFSRKAAVYIAPSIDLNPTLYHSNIENHTYLSTTEFIGVSANLIKSVFIDLKFGYHIGLTGAYFENGQYSKYNGPEILLGIKYRLKNQD